MRSLALIAALSLLLAACGSPPDAPNTASAGASETPRAGAVPAANAAAPAAPGWRIERAAEGTALALLGSDGSPTIRLLCAARNLHVDVPGFRPIASEERLSLGSGNQAVALVAAIARQPRRNGVSAAGATPENLAALIGGPLSASYGAQTSGPHPAPPAQMAQAFVAACTGGSGAAPPIVAPAAAPSSPCLVQGSERLEARPLRAVGTEPFWGARIEGRCVTYSHPDDQQGTRVWTRFTAGPGGGTWRGALGGRPFELRTRPQPGCSDGMSDRRYPIAVDLVVNGERRSGCAEPG